MDTTEKQISCKMAQKWNRWLSFVFFVAHNWVCYCFLTFCSRFLFCFFRFFYCINGRFSCFLLPTTHWFVCTFKTHCKSFSCSLHYVSWVLRQRVWCLQEGKNGVIVDGQHVHTFPCRHLIAQVLPWLDCGCLDFLPHCSRIIEEGIYKQSETFSPKLYTLVVEM